MILTYASNVKVDSHEILPSRPIGEFSLRKWDKVDAKVKRFSTWSTISKWLISFLLWKI